MLRSSCNRPRPPLGLTNSFDHNNPKFHRLKTYKLKLSCSSVVFDTTLARSAPSILAVFNKMALSTKRTSSRVDEQLKQLNLSVGDLSDILGGDDCDSLTSDGRSLRHGNEAMKGEEAAATRDPELAQKETRVVRFMKALVVAILLAATAAVMSGVYLYTRNDQVSEWEETFQGYAQQIRDTVHRNAQHKLEAIGAIALQIQTYALNNNRTWPNVTVPYFEEIILTTKSLTNAYGVQLFPIITNENRAEWEAYSVQHRYWINESYATQRKVYGEDQSKLEPGATSQTNFSWWHHLWGDDHKNASNPAFSSGISDRIFGTEHEDPDEYDPVIDISGGPFYFPQWQSAPMSWYYHSTVNSNYGNFLDFYQQTQIIMNTSTAAFGEAWTDGNTPGRISTLLYPIFDQIYDGKVAAFVSVDLFWEAFLERILPPNADGIYVVIENTCDQVFTFMLNGEDAAWLGDGDLHEQDSKYNEKKESFVFGSQLMEPITSPTYTGRPLYNSFCPYTFSIYPSRSLEDQYVTNSPIVYTVVVCLIFLFTSLVFFTYDYCVERRQKLVLKTAKRSDAVVSSLFPKDVKERLYIEQEQQEQSTSEPAVKEFMGISNPMKKKANGQNPAASNQTETRSASGPMEASPIARLYPETTILFADLVGFTKWSSGREPKDVFKLLESLVSIVSMSCARALCCSRMFEALIYLSSCPIILVWIL